MDADTIKLIFSIVSLVVAVLSLAGFGTVTGMMWKDRHDKKKADKEEIEELKSDARKASLKEVISAELTTALAPIVGTLQTITTDLGYLKKGTQATCRNDLEDIFKKAEKDGYCSNEDKQRFEQTYQAYHSLGKNGVMDAKHAKILGLPDKKPVRHTTPKRRRLTEGED